MSIQEITQRIPLFKKEWTPTLKRLAEHEHAPRWNALCGDRLTQEDLNFVENFHNNLNQRKGSYSYPDHTILKWITDLKNQSWWFENALKGILLEKEFFLIPFMSREDLQTSLVKIVPHSLPLTNIIVNPTSGTTGQPILCPSHPKSQGCYDPLIQFALSKNGLSHTFSYPDMAAIQLCAQQQTITYYTVHSYLKGAGFAKINLNNPADWKTPESPALFIEDMAPIFLSGDPFSFYQAILKKIPYQPQALLSTALTLDGFLYEAIKKYYSCPIINFYSLNETGPLGYSCPHDPTALHLLPTDIFIETITEDGHPQQEDLPGEIVVTGGRNPFLPLLRYRTGDFAILDKTPCSCGDPQPKLKNLQARKPVFFLDSQNNLINPIDISRILKDYPVAFHQMIQSKNKSCLLYLHFFYPLSSSIQEEIKNKVSALFQHTISLELAEKNFLPGEKFLPYINELNFKEYLSP